MKKTFLIRLSAGMLALGGAWVAYTQNNAKAPPELKINKVFDDLYEIEGDGGNVAVYITNEGVIMVDDKYEQDHDQIMSKVKSVTSQPIKYILSTHYHADHSGGNTRFTTEAEIISTRNAHDGIVQHKQSNAPAGMVAARVTFTDETDIFLGGKEVRARYFGRGHTNGDAVVYFPALRTVHTGDLVTSGTPLIDYPGGGSIVEWTKTLDAVVSNLDFDTVIPGHGPVEKKADLITYRNNAEKLRTRVQEQIRQGKSQADVGKFMTAEYKWAPDSLNMQWSLPGMMAELK
jgi:glyoxylase-like metal-dependent hydrolase (beta-lactamase superfamily II)